MVVISKTLLTFSCALTSFSLEEKIEDIYSYNSRIILAILISNITMNIEYFKLSIFFSAKGIKMVCKS